MNRAHLPPFHGVDLLSNARKRKKKEKRKTIRTQINFDSNENGANDMVHETKWICLWTRCNDARGWCYAYGVCRLLHALHAHFHFRFCNYFATALIRSHPLSIAYTYHCLDWPTALWAFLNIVRLVRCCRYDDDQCCPILCNRQLNNVMSVNRPHPIRRYLSRIAGVACNETKREKKASLISSLLRLIQSNAMDNGNPKKKKNLHKTILFTEITIRLDHSADLALIH